MEATNAQKLAQRILELLNGDEKLDITSIDLNVSEREDGSFVFHVNRDFDSDDGVPRRQVWEVNVNMIENSSADDD